MWPSVFFRCVLPLSEVYLIAIPKDSVSRSSGQKKKKKIDAIYDAHSSLTDLYISAPQASHAELMVMTVSDIVNQLVAAHEQKKDINLNR